MTSLGSAGYFCIPYTAKKQSRGVSNQMYLQNRYNHGQIGERGQGVRTPQPGNLQVAMCFLRDTGTDPLEKQLDFMGPNATRMRSVQPSVKYVDD